MGESSLLRGMKVIDALAERGRLRFTEIREEVLGGLNPASTSRVLRDLCLAGVIRKGGEGGYVLARKVLLWQRGVLAADPLAATARPVLERISGRFAVTAAFFMCAGRSLVCLARVTAPFAPALTPPGTFRPVNVIASGGVFFLDPETRADVDGLLAEARKDESASPSRAVVVRILDTFAREGVFDDWGEVYPACRRVAVPVGEGGMPRGVLSTGSPKEFFSDPAFRNRLLAALREEAGRMAGEVLFDG